MKFIGLVVHSGKIRINQEIIDSVANLKKKRKRRNKQGILPGYLNYHRQYIQDFVQIAIILS